MSARLVFAIAFAIVFLLAGETGRAASVELGLGVNYEYFSYQEQLASPAKSTETAVFPSLVGLARIYVVNDSYLQLRAEYATNIQSQYSGTALTSNADVETIDPLAFQNYEADAYISLTERFYLYVGYGYRHWNRFLSGGLGYREIYNWYYTPVGAQFWFVKDPGFEFGLDASIRPTSNGTIQVITSATQPNGQDSQMNLGQTTGYKVMVPTRFRYGSWSLLLTPWYEVSSIGQSNLVTNSTLSPQANTGILEPSSNTTQFGLDGVVTYTF